MMTTLQIEIPEELAAYLEQLAEAEDRSVSEVVTEVIEQHSRNLETTPEELDELKRRDAELDQLIAEGKMIPQEQARRESRALLEKLMASQ